MFHLWAGVVVSMVKSYATMVVLEVEENMIPVISDRFTNLKRHPEWSGTAWNLYG